MRLYSVRKTSVRGCARPDLIQMPLLVRNVVLDEEAQGDRRILTYYAAGLKPLCADLFNHRGQNLVLRAPPAKQRFPALLGVAMRGYPGLLRVLGPGVPAFNRCAYKPLAVVGRRVHHVTDNLLACPPARSPRYVGKLSRNLVQLGAHSFHLGAKPSCKFGGHSFSLKPATVVKTRPHQAGKKNSACSFQNGCSWNFDSVAWAPTLNTAVPAA